MLNMISSMDKHMLHGCIDYVCVCVCEEHSFLLTKGFVCWSPGHVFSSVGLMGSRHGEQALGIMMGEWILLNNMSCPVWG